MSRSMIKRPSKLKATSRLRALPWAGLAQAGLAAGRRWRALSPKDRANLTRLVRDSRGKAGNLSSKERKELGKLVRKLDLKGLGRDVLAPLRGGRRKRRR